MDMGKERGEETVMTFSPSSLCPCACCLQHAWLTDRGVSRADLCNLIFKADRLLYPSTLGPGAFENLHRESSRRREEGEWTEGDQEKRRGGDRDDVLARIALPLRSLALGSAVRLALGVALLLEESLLITRPA